MDAQAIEKAFSLLMWSPLLFERGYPRAEYLSRFTEAKRQARGNRVVFERSCFMLAYLGEDFDRNVNAILERDIHPQQWQEAYLARDGNGIHGSQLHPENGSELLPAALGLLYARSGNVSVLRDLLDLLTDGHIAEEQGENVGLIWEVEPIALLRAASGSPRRVGRLTRMLTWRDIDNQRMAANLEATLTALQRHPDAAVAQTALQLLQGVQEEGRKFNAAQRKKSKR